MHTLYKNTRGRANELFISFKSMTYYLFISFCWLVGWLVGLLFPWLVRQIMQASYFYLLLAGPEISAPSRGPPR